MAMMVEAMVDPLIGSVTFLMRLFVIGSTVRPRAWIMFLPMIPGVGKLETFTIGASNVWPSDNVMVKRCVPWEDNAPPPACEILIPDDGSAVTALAARAWSNVVASITEVSAPESKRS